MCITEYNEVKTLADERMEGHEEGLAEGREEGRIEGRMEGRAEGESRLAALILKLNEAGRGEDAFKAASDPAFRAKLYQEFRLA